MIGVIYARYSEGPRQTDQSIEGQVADCMAFAKRNGIEISEVYADRHISGKSIVGRYEFQRMLDDAARHQFDCVIVWKIDRFGRDRQDIALSKLKLKKAGVKLLYAEESVPEGPEGIILESVLEGIAEYYSADLRQKVLRGRRETLKKGKYCGGILPLGYRLDEDHRVVLDEATAPAIREAFRMYSTGSKIVECIAFLDSKGVHGRSGSVSKSAFGRMLRNEKYLGIFDVSGVELRADPLIDEATFRICQELLPVKHFSPAGSDYLLSCKCYCGQCGSMLIGECGTGKSGMKFQYYKCGGKKRGGECTLKPAAKNELEQLILKATREDMLTGETVPMLVDEILRVQETDLADDPVKRLQSALDGCRKKQRNILRAIEETGAAGLAKRLAELEQEERDLSLEIKMAQVKRPRLTREDVEAWLSMFRSGDAEDPEFQKSLLETFVARCELYPDKVIVFYNISKKSKQKRELPWCSDGSRVLEESVLHPNTPLVLGDFIVLLVPRAA